MRARNCVCVAALLWSVAAGAQTLPSEQALAKRIARYEEITQHSPRDVGSWHDLADLYREAKRWDDAIAAETRAIEGHPKFAIAYYGRGKAQMAKKNFGAAREDFDKAIEWYEKRAGHDAYFTLEQASDEHVDAYRTRGMAWANEGKFTDGLADLSIAIRMKKNDAQLHWERAYLYEKAGKTSEAVVDYKFAGLLYFDMGSRKKAEECAETLLRLKATKEAAEIRQRLEKKEESDLP